MALRPPRIPLLPAYPLGQKPALLGSVYLCMHAHSLQSCLTLCDPMGCSPPDSSVHGILQARMLDWVALMPLPYINITQLRTSKTVGHVKSDHDNGCHVRAPFVISWILVTDYPTGPSRKWKTPYDLTPPISTDSCLTLSTEQYSSSHAKQTLACSHVSYWGTILQMSRLRFGVRSKIA